MEPKGREITVTLDCSFAQAPRKAPNLELKWSSGPDAPLGMRGYVQSVKIQGRVYIGGGHMGRGTIDKHTIMRYDIHSEKWSLLPPYRMCDFAMATTVGGRLVLVGGEEGGRKSKTLGVWGGSRDDDEEEGKEWTHPYPEMPTARSDSSAVLYKEWLVVVGGISSVGVALSSVEVLNTYTKQWYAGPPAMTSMAYMRAVSVGETCYFMGGTKGKIETLSGTTTENAYSVSLPALIGQLNSRNARERDKQIRKEMWRKIRGLQACCSTPLSLCVGGAWGGALLAVGGRERDREAVTGILRYEPDAGRWSKVGDLPVARYDCACVMTAEREMLVVGGHGHSTVIKNVDIARITIK